MDLKKISLRVAAEPGSVPSGMKHAIFHTYDNDEVVVAVPDGDLRRLEEDLRKLHPTLEFEIREVDVYSVEELRDHVLGFGGSVETPAFGDGEPEEDPGPPEA